MQVPLAFTSGDDTVVLVVGEEGDCNTREEKFGRIQPYDLWKEICKVAL